MPAKYFHRTAVNLRKSWCKKAKIVIVLALVTVLQQYQHHWSSFSKNLVIDPILEEENYQDGSLMITCMPSRYEITQLTVTGEWCYPKINEGMQLCLDACVKLAKIMRSCLKEAASDSTE